MRHRVAKKKFDKDASHLKSLLKGMTSSVIMHGHIDVSLARAKYVKSYVERLVTRAKSDTSFNTVQYMRTKISDAQAIKKLLTDIAPVYFDRNGGYMRIVKTGFRIGDHTQTGRLEWVGSAEVSK